MKTLLTLLCAVLLTGCDEYTKPELLRETMEVKLSALRAKQEKENREMCYGIGALEAYRIAKLGGDYNDVRNAIDAFRDQGPSNTWVQDWVEKKKQAEELAKASEAALEIIYDNLTATLPPEPMPTGLAKEIQLRVTAPNPLDNRTWTWNNMAPDMQVTIVRDGRTYKAQFVADSHPTP